MGKFLAILVLATLLGDPAAADLTIPRPPIALSPDQAGQATTPLGGLQVARPGPIQVPVSSTSRPLDYAPLDPIYLPQLVAYHGPESAGTIIIDTVARFLFLVLEDHEALRYGVGVGRPGFEWAGVHHVTRKAEWPEWRPPPEMRERMPGLPSYRPGGPGNPLGARALYLGSTLYRIHGSNEPWTIGQAVSSGCIRMRNEDVIDLYQRVPVGAKVIVL